MSKKRDNKNRVLEKGESQLPDGRYKHRYTDVNGDRQEYYSYRLVDSDKTPKGKKHKDSIRAYKFDVAVAQKDGIDINKENTTLNQLFDICINHKLDSGQIKAETFHSYNNVWKHTRKHKTANSIVKVLRESDFQKLYSDLLISGMGSGSIKLLHKVHNVVMKFGCKEDYVRYNYAHEALKGFDIPLNRRKALTIKQQEKFVAFLKENEQFNHLYNVVTFMLETAIRVSEMTALTLHDLDLENRILSIDKQYLYQIHGKESHSGAMKMTPPKTETSVRKIPLSENAVNIITEQIDFLESLDLIDNFEVPHYREGEVCKNFLFLGQHNRLWKSASFDTYLRSAVNVHNGLELILAEQEEREPILLPKMSAHILRHTACTRLSEQGMCIKVRQQLMGHKHLSTTADIYDHVDKQRLRQEMKRVDELRQTGTT